MFKMEITKSNQKKKENNNNPHTNTKWFSFLKKSFGICKRRKESKKEETKIVLVDKNSSNNFEKIPLNSNCKQESYFTNDFLNSIVLNSNNKIPFNDSFKFKDYGDLETVKSRRKIDGVLNSILNYIKKEPNKIENILLLIVNDYINEICERMLQEKMNSVYRRLENWYKNSLTRPGFKIIDSKFSGDINNHDNSFSLVDKQNFLKEENVFGIAHFKRKELISKGIKKITENIKKSSNLNENIEKELTILKSSRKVLSSNSKFEKPQNKASNFESGQNNKPSEMNNKDFCYVHNLTDKSESSFKVFFKRNSKTKSGRKTSVIKSTSFSNLTDEEFTYKSSRSNSILKSNPKLYCLKSKTSLRKKSIHSKDLVMKDNKLKPLNVSEIVTIDVKPLIGIFDERSYISSEESLNLTFEEIERNMNKEKRSIETNKRENDFRIRRSVTFLEPSRYISNSTLHTQKRLCSSAEELLDNKFPNISCTKNEELKCYTISNALTTSQKDEGIKIDTFRLKCSDVLFQNPNNKQKDWIYDKHKIYNCKKRNDSVIFNFSDNIMKSNSAIVVSLQSSPSLLKDESNMKVTKFSCQRVSKYDKNERKNNLLTTCENEIQKANFQIQLNSNILKVKDKLTPERDQQFFRKDLIKKKKIKKDMDGFHKRFFSDNYEIKKSTFQNSLNKSSLSEDEFIAYTNSVDFAMPPSHSSTQQEIVLGLDDNNTIDCNLQSLSKPSLISKIKTANFSSSSILEETQLNLDSAVNHTSSYLSFSKNSIKESEVLNYITFRPPQIKTDNIKSRIITSDKLVKKQHFNNLLQHTVASKQKCRLKVYKKTDNAKKSMKFSTSVRKNHKL